MRITNAPSSTQLTATILQPLGNVFPHSDPAVYAPVDAGEWEVGPEVTVLGGLQHLEGQFVAILADGSALEEQEVSSEGTITLETPASKVIAGLGFQAQLQTLYLDIGDPTIQGRRKNLVAMTTRLDQARGLKVGQTFDKLVPMKEVPPANYTPPAPLVTGDERTTLVGGWNTQGQLCLQQDYPLPATVLGVVPEVAFGDTGR